jgi:glutamyl-tRNA synthetase
MVRVRFAPSPTGFLHIGSARTAIFNWLFARHEGGQLLLRIEDTDLKRSEARFLDEILKDLRWLGVDWDGEPVFQSRRFDVYRAKAAELVAAGKARREGDAVLFPVSPGRTVRYDDLVHGPIAVETDNIKEQVLIKSDGSPAYNFSCVVDDSELGITHILRGDDHISNTPKQILFYEAFGLEAPRFGHMPLILGTDGAKLSKRHGGVSVEEYRQAGFLPEALANYLVLLGWTPPDGREIMPPAEAARLFEIKDMGAVQAKFDIQKLRWLNGEYIAALPDARLLPLLRETLAAAGFAPAGLDDAYLGKIAALYRIRIKTLGEFPPLVDFFFRDDFAVEPDAAEVLAKPDSRAFIAAFAERVETMEPFSHDAIDKACRKVASERGVKASAVIHPVRAAISGKTKGAGLFEMLEVLGRTRTLGRLRRAAHGPTQA